MTNCFDQIFKKEGKWINIYQGTEEIQDPFEKNTITTFINPKAIKAIVKDIAFAKIKWAMPGVITERAKQIVISKKYRSLLENSSKIEICNDDREIEVYSGWKENGKMQYMIEGDYIRAYIYSKHI